MAACLSGVRFREETRSLVGRATRHEYFSRIAGGVSWSLAGSGLAQMLGLLAAIVAARCLGSTEYGHFAIILATADLFTTIGAAGLGVTATKHVAEFRKSDPRRAGRIIGASLATAVLSGAATAVVFVGLSPWLSRDMLRAPALQRPLMWSAGILFFACFNGCQVGALTGFEAFKALAIANLVRGLAAVPLVTAGAVYGELAGVVWAYGIVAGINCVAHALLLQRECRLNGVVVSFQLHFAEVRALYGFSAPVMIGAVSYAPSVWLSSTFVVRTAGFAELGKFNAAMQWQTAILFLANAVGNLGLPMLSSVLPERNLARYKQVLKLIFTLTSSSAVLAALPVCLASPFIMKAYGASFASGSRVLIVLAASAVLNALTLVVGHAIWSLNAPVAGMLFALGRGMTLIFCAFVLAGLGALGLAFAYLITMLIQALAVGPYMARLLRGQAREWSGYPAAAVC